MAPQLQHYIPRFILRRFHASAEHTVHVYDKHAGRRFVAGTSKIAAEKALYDFEFDGANLTLEPGLAELEDRAAKRIERIVTNNRLNLLDSSERDDLSKFFAVQLVRTPAHRETWRELEGRMETYLRSEGMREEFFTIDARLGSRENSDRALAASTIMNAPPTFGPTLAAKDWVLMRTELKSPYLIGDHPLVMHNSRDHGPRGNIGLNVIGIEIYFPLSPQITLGMMCGSHRKDFEEALGRTKSIGIQDPRHRRGIEIAREFIQAVVSGEAVSMDTSNVDFMNSLQIARAERFLFSRSGDFSLAEKMIADYPHMRRGARIDEATGKF
jgi:hypothetical protein